MLGDVVARESVVLATKAGIHAPGRPARWSTPRAAALLAALDASLARLGVDHVDLWQVHAWDRTDAARGDPARAGRTP